MLIHHRWWYSRAFQESYPHPYPPAPGEPYYQQYHVLLSSTTAALVIAYLCLVVDIIGLVTGATIFSARINAFQSFVHFWGSVFTCWFVCEFHLNFIALISYSSLIQLTSFKWMDSVCNEGRIVVEHCWMDTHSDLLSWVDKYVLRVLKQKTSNQWHWCCWLTDTRGLNLNSE